ncbi:MAG: CRISPR-associated protein Cas5 [Rhodanobacteraceae bacterium]|nr:CRISPR-associated protein Cas5 [Rhodanobacteraceae bacterium]MBK7044589.1 CRISPR-associated protein Cas5 [Rhodanobacteraceae bacterium]
MDAALSALKREAALHPERPELCARLLERATHVADAGTLLPLPPDLPSLAFICCSIKPTVEARFRAEVARAFADWPAIELIVLNDARSLAEAYNRGAATTRSDWIIFCHDDIRFLRTDFAARVAHAMQLFDVFGPAGAIRADGPAALWGGPESGRAQVSYPLPDGRIIATLSGIGPAHQSACLLDGLFIAARRTAWQQQPFDAQRFDAFHLYDMDFSLGCHRAGLRVGIAQDLHLLHDSLGNFDERWSDYAERFVSKYNLVVDAPHQNPTQAIALGRIDQIAPLFDAINAA